MDSHEAASAVAPPPPARARRKPTMKEIAAKAGVSTGTVSRVLSGKTDVAAHLANRVLQVAREMGYEWKRSRQQSAHGEGGVGPIGYLIDTEDSASLSEPFFQHFLTGIAQAATARKGHVVFSPCRDEVLRNTIPPMIRNRLVNAVILKSMHRTPDAWLKEIDSMIPTVLLMHYSADRSISSVICDNYGAMYQILDYLRNLGHSRIGFYAEWAREGANSLHNVERYWAFVRVSTELGLPMLPEYVQRPVRQDGESLESQTRRTLRAFLQLGDKRPTAIVGAADVYALDLLRVADQENIRVPADLSVVGFMNTPACQHSHPPLTSVNLCEEDMGRLAVECVRRRMASPRERAQHLVVETKLVERMSCASPSA